MWLEEISDYDPGAKAPSLQYFAPSGAKEVFELNLSIIKNHSWIEI
jgi:hypothetical protein